MNVTAISENAIAHPGNREPNYIIVSVTNQNGEPITGLSVTNIRVRTLIVGPGGADTQVSRVGGGADGIYYIDVIPVQSYTWVSGTYIFGVFVTRGAQRGQTLTSVLMD
jgi:hypothetical protein